MPLQTAESLEASTWWIMKSILPATPGSSWLGLAAWCVFPTAPGQGSSPTAEVGPSSPPPRLTHCSPARLFWGERAFPWDAFCPVLPFFSRRKAASDDSAPSVWAPYGEIEAQKELAQSHRAGRQAGRIHTQTPCPQRPFSTSLGSHRRRGKTPSVGCGEDGRETLHRHHPRG